MPEIDDVPDDLGELMPAPRLELTWPNKDKFLLVPKDQDGKPVWVDTDHPAAAEVRISDFAGAIGEVNEDDPHADNLLFIGDSLDVLRILNEVPEYRQHYRGKVKLIYIDPPFNTGQTFTHYDDWMEHSTWLSFMRDRLVLMKELLSPDGTIWIHLDDVEVHRMRCLMDEVFGANFVGSIIWERTNKPKNDAGRLSSIHDTILVYARDIAKASLGGLPRANKSAASYNKVDEQGNKYLTLTLRKTGSNSLREDAPGGWFPIVGPDGIEVWPRFPDGREGCWRWGPSKVEREGDKIEWVQKRDGTWDPCTRIYLDETTPRSVDSIWSHEATGSTTTAAYEMKALFPDVRRFSTPKPERLMERIVHLASKPGDIIVDVFGGSGTTAAVAHKMGRRWVTCEVLPETVVAFTQPRLIKVLAGEDGGGITKSADWLGGGGFRTVEVGPSMYEMTDYGVLLAGWATNGRFARAVAGQLGFEWQSKRHAPFCGQRGRMRLAVLDGAVGEEEVRQIVAALGENERVTVVAKAILPGAAEVLSELSPGSKVRKAPRDVLAPARKRRNRRKVVAS